MTPSRNRRNALLLGFRVAAGPTLSSIAVLTALLGCSANLEHATPDPGKTTGQILVGEPKVWERARLIQDRQRQREWLLEQLSKSSSATFGYQGEISRSTLRSRSSQLGLDLRPEVGLGALETELQETELRRNEELAELQHEVEKAQLQAALDRLEAGEEITTPASGSAAQPSQPEGSGITSSDSTSQSDADFKAIADLLPSLPSAAATERPADTFREHLAYRQVIREALLANDLDDAHDLRGNTLYRLSFDATVIPGWDTSRWAVIEVLPKARSGAYKCPSGVTRETPLDALRPVYDAWRQARNEFRLRQEREQAKTETRVSQAVDDDLTSNQLIDEFCAALQRLAVPRGTEAIGVYSVAPALTAERIRDLLASRQLREQELTLAALAGAVGIDAAVKAAEALDLQAEAIRRQPVVLAFSNQGGAQASEAVSPSFGWLLGPRFRTDPDGRSFEFRQQADHHALTAVVSLPAWWPLIDLEVKTYWLSSLDPLPDSAGSDGSDAATPQATADETTVTYELSLPSEEEAILVSLELTDEDPRAPYAFFQNTPPRLTIGKKDSFVIWGNNLWREPMVVVGGQVASDVKVLPNMNGLLVAITPDQPAGWTPSQTSGLEEVWLWTSTGEAWVGDAELFKPPKSSKAGSETASVPFEVILSGNTVVADPAGQGIVELRVAPKKAGTVLDPVSLSVENARFDSASTLGGCIDVATFVINSSCRVELGLGNLVSNTTVTLKAWQKKDGKKLEHAALSIHVRDR